MGIGISSEHHGVWAKHPHPRHMHSKFERRLSPPLFHSKSPIHLVCEVVYVDRAFVVVVMRK